MTEDRLHKIARKIAGLDPIQSGKSRTAGKIEFIRDQGPVRRDLRVDGFTWPSDSLRDLAKVLWAGQRAHSYAMAAYRTFSKMPSSQMSPDGLLGGRGYIQEIKQMRTSLSQGVEILSAFTDTVHDEINAEHWRSTDQGGTSELVEDAEQVKANPEQFVEQQYEEAAPDEAGPAPGGGSDWDEEEEEPVKNPDADALNPEMEEDEEDEEEEEQAASAFTQTAGSFDKAKDLQAIVQPEPEEPSSALPTGTGEQPFGKTDVEQLMHTTSPKGGQSSFGSKYARAIQRILQGHAARTASARTADSSIDPATLPGPRVMHVGPGMSESGGWGDGSASDDPLGDGLGSGTNESQHLYEDWCVDGVTGQDNPTDGDTSVLNLSVRLSSDNYSWLPGANNDKNMNYYQRGLTEQDIQWMREHASPPLPAGIKPEEKKYDSRSLWEVEL